MKAYIVLACAVVACARANPQATCPQHQLDDVLALVEEASARRDGALGPAIDAAIVGLLMSDAEHTLRWLAAHPNVLEHFRVGLSTTVFTDYTGSQAPALKRKRDELVRQLQSFAFGDPDLEKLRQELLQIALRAEIRVVD